MKKNIILSAALMFFAFTASAQTTITFDTDDYQKIGVYDMWEESPFRTGALTGNAAVADNPDTEADEVLGVAPNGTGKVVAFQRSRHGSNTYGVRIDLKEPLRVTKQLQYIHVMTYLKDKPADSRMMVIGLGKRLEKSWEWQTGDDEQFWAVTTSNVKPKEGWQDVVVSFKGFSYSMEEKVDSGIDIYSLVIVPDVRSPHADENDWVAYIDEIVIDNTPDKRFSTDKYALTYEKDANTTRNDRKLNSVGFTSAGVSYSSAAVNGKVYSDNTTNSVFSAKAGAEVQPTFGYSGNWMSGYVYVDWNNDGRFDYAVNEEENKGTPAAGSEIVSYSAAQIDNAWYKSDGTTTGNGNTIGAGVPKFTVPAGTPDGLYRMRYKVDWDNRNPAGANDIISNGGGYIDVMLDVHGDNVVVNASQLNGDIVLAADESPLQNYSAAYGQPLKVKIVPAPEFVQYGFVLKYGYNVNASQQLDDNGNPNYIEVKVPYSAINGDSTYTIPAEYIRGRQVSIVGDMQQVQQYTVRVVGLEGQGGAVYANVETLDGDMVNATQFFSAEQVTAIPVEGYTGTVAVEDRVVVVTYALAPDPYRQVSSLSELKNYKLYHISAKSGEGYWAWNSTITDEYVSLRGVTNTSHNGEPSDAAVLAKYKEEIHPFDVTVAWQIISEDGKYYLYHPARKAYVTRDGRNYKFTETKTALDAIYNNSSDCTFAIHAGGGYSENSTNFACIVTNENEMAVRNWTSSDHGAVLQIIENPNVYALQYVVEVTGANGGVVLDGANYVHGDTVKATQFLSAADVEAKDVIFYAAEVAVDKENAKICVTYTASGLNTDRYYTLECKSAASHNTTRFMSDNGTVINGQSAQASYFVFEPGETEGTYYIKSLVSGKYVNSDGSTISAGSTKSTAWILGVPSHTPDAVTFGLSGDKYLNNNGTKCNDGTCTNLQPNTHVGGPGAGNACSLWKLTSYNAQTTCVITYSFKFEGVEIFTQTSMANVGGAFPDYNVSLPYGIVAAAKPEGTVGGDAACDIALTVGTALPFETASDVEGITTWYYAKMHSNQPKYIQALEDGTIEWADAEVVAGEEESHLWGFVGNAWGIKVVSKNGKAIVSTNGDAVLGNASDATAFVVTTSSATDNGFCLKYPDNANYLNGHNGAVKSWDDNDAGSTFLLEEYQDQSNVEMTKSDIQSSVIYDLTGRRVEKAVKGIYIVNGRKVIFQ